MVGFAHHYVKNERNTTYFLGGPYMVVGVADHHVKNERKTTCFLGELDNR